MVWQLLQYNGAYEDLSQDLKKALKPRLAVLRLKGNLTKLPISRPLGDGLFEVRSRKNKVQIRLLYGFLPGRRIVFVLGVTKDQRTLRKATIDKAREFLKQAMAESELSDVVTIH